MIIHNVVYVCMADAIIQSDLKCFCVYCEYCVSCNAYICVRIEGGISTNIYFKFYNQFN